MSYLTIPTEDIEVGKPVKKSLWQKIKDNFDNHESRIAALSAGANKIGVFEYHLDPKDLGIGQIISADMTLSEYQEIYGDGWIIADGSSCVGSVYASVTGHTAVPDLRNEFLRGASGTVDLGTHYDDTTAVNGLSVQNAGQSGVISVAVALGANAFSTPAGSHSHGLIGDSETAPQHYGVNFFIKINLSAQDNVVRFKAREAMSIVSVKGYIVDNNGLPTSGNFELDIKKGATVAALSSVYITKPTLAWSGPIADGDATSSGTVSAGGYDVAAGDWLQLDITSVMVGQSGIYIQVFGEPA